MARNQSPMTTDSDSEDFLFGPIPPLQLFSVTSQSSHLGLHTSYPIGTPRARRLSLPALSSPSVFASSPIVGTKEERQSIIRQKAARKRQATLAARKNATQEEEKASLNVRLNKVIKYLSEQDVSVGQLTEYIFNPECGQGTLRWDSFFRNRGQATQILNFWISSGNSPTAREEVREWAVNYVTQIVSQEARSVTQQGLLRYPIIGAGFIEQFSFNSLYTSLQQKYATVSMRIFESIATSARQLTSPLSPARLAKKQTVITSAALACFGEYSALNNITKRLMALYLYATGSQRQPLMVLSHLGISESYSNLVAKVSSILPNAATTTKRPRKTPGTLKQLSDAMRQKARDVAASGIFGVVYDNINFMSRTAEQIVGRTDVLESGTCATLWPLHKAHRDDMKIEDLHRSFDNASPLSISDILHSPDEAQKFRTCLTHCILRIIIQHGGTGFSKFQADLDKSLPQTVKQIDVHKTALYPLPTWKIDESTIVGNADVDAAIVQELHLRNQSTTWLRIVRILAGDQLSIARLRSLANLRAGQEGGYSSFSWGAWMPGLFHTKIADMHGFFVTHWGKSNAGTRNPGCLAFHNTQLHRLPISLTSLPTFRICHDLIFVSLYARVLHCLLLVSKKASLDDYITSVGSWDVLYHDAEKILSLYATTRQVSDLRWKRSMELNPGDMVFENAVLFLRDALISREFTDAIKAGDSGRILLVIKAWALSFRGNGRTKYAYEMLHLIHNLTHIWPVPLRDIILNNWLLNPTGKRNSFVEVDLVQEHLNFWIKTFYKAHGSNVSWEWLELISPCVNALRHLATMMKDVLGSDIGTRHALADLSKDIKVLMESLSEHKVYTLMHGRVLDDDDPPVIDIMSVGLQNLTDNASNPLTDYNTAFKRLQRRRRLVPIVGGEDDIFRLQSTLPSLVSNTLSPSIETEPSQTFEIDNSVMEDGFEDEEVSELDRTMENDDGETLERLTAEDVAFNMDMSTGGFEDDEIIDGENGELDFDDDLEDMVLSEVINSRE